VLAYLALGGLFLFSVGFLCAFLDENLRVDSI
jgi:hypothetical protein